MRSKVSVCYAGTNGRAGRHVVRCAGKALDTDNALAPNDGAPDKCRD